MKKDISGTRFGRWKAVRFVGRIKGNSVWLCHCDCGQDSEVSLGNLTSGASQSCGCIRRELMTTHGQYKSRTYSIWQNMNRRCADLDEKHYGAKGIKVCDRWRSFKNFLSDMGEAPKGASIDRIDNEKGYELCNCRWATVREQMRNTSRTVKIEFNGEILCRSDWAKRIGISAPALEKRLRHKSVEHALTTSAHLIKRSRCA